MHVYSNTAASSFNHCYSGKVIRSTHSDCAFVALGTKHATRKHRVIVCGLPGSTKCFQTLINGTIFETSYLIQNVHFDFL